MGGGAAGGPPLVAAVEPQPVEISPSDAKIKAPSCFMANDSSYLDALA